MEPPYIKIGGEAEAGTETEKRGHWMVANITQSIAWTTKPATVDYAGRVFVLLPEDDKLYPAIAVRGDVDDGRRAILEFISALSWSRRGHITIDSWTGGGHLHRMGKKKIGGQVIASSFQIDYLPAPEGKDQKLALAMYHEGLSLIHVHVAYSFLSFYKIINLVGGSSGARQQKWINKHLGAIDKNHLPERLKQLQKDKIDIGKYIYQSCRCAIAHAGDPRNPPINPHNVEDQKRLYSDLPIVTALAEIALEKELGVKTSHAVYTEHRYELSGFEQHLGSELVGKLKAGETIESGSYSVPDSLDIRLWGKKPIPTFQGMSPQPGMVEKGVLAIPCLSKSKRYLVYLLLDFPKYRLKIHIRNPDNYVDDGTPESIEEIIDVNDFEFDHFCNGKVEVWGDDQCLGRCDPFIPLNMMADPKGHETQKKQLQEEVARRRAARP